MKRFILITLVLSMLAAVTGCAVEDKIKEQLDKIFPEEERQTSEEKELIEKPNIINMGVYDFDTFNPLTTKSRSVAEAMQLVYEPLFTVDGEMRAQAVLASDFNVSADGKTININLKQNVTWHDGTQFTAKDVAYTIKVILAGETEYTQSLSNLADYTMTDDYSIQLVLKNSVPRFEATLTFPIVQYQTDMKADESYIPNGTGPFYYASKARVDELRFEAYENYYGGRANIDTLYIHKLPSSAEYLTMLEASEIDFASSETVDLSTYMPKANLEIYNFPSNKMVFLGYNLENEMLVGANTRNGISELIDKEDIVETAIFSRGTAVNIPVNPSSYLYYIEETDFSSDKLTADDFLGNDGWGPNADGQYVREVDGVEQVMSFEILVNADDADLTSTAQTISEHLNNFNIQTVVSEVSSDEFESRIAAKDYDMFVDRIDTGNNGDLSAIVSSEGNPMGYNNPAVDAICAQLGMTRDEEEEKALTKQYCSLILNDMPFLPLYFEKGTVLSTTNVISGVDPTESFLYKNSSQWSVRE
ncbi:MAG: ABC transporter substrate-binding protein [Firmicutes bacterium]|nr:ABC transporter substrate-binding protein [Bacillota bacterium]